jgi:hypothetical protein
LSARGPPTDWGELVQAHDDRDVLQASPEDLPVIDIDSLRVLPDGETPQRPQKNTTPGGSQAFRVPSVRDHETGHAAHEPLSSSKMPAKVLEEVPLTGLSFEQS